MLSLPVQALLMGLFSALSLPLGALVGLACSPVPERVTARFMAFGSGALVFAVATQLYGQTIARLQAAMDEDCHAVSKGAKRNHFRNLQVQIVFGVIGAFLYKALNSWLERLARPSAERSASADVCEEGLSMEMGGTQPAPSPDSSFGSSRSLATRMRTAALSDPAAYSVSNFARQISRASSRHELRMPDSNGQQIALSMWLGVTLDGVPEALMLGLMTNEHTISWDFLVAIFIANFPEAFSAASLLRGYGVNKRTIVGMWLAVFVMTGLLAMLGSAVIPADLEGNHQLAHIRDAGTAGLEGFTGGAMLAMVSTAMIPEAYNHAPEFSGILFVAGFLISVWLNGVGLYYGSPQNIKGTEMTLFS